MSEQLKGILRYIAPFSDDELNEIVACIAHKTVQRNALLLAEGQVCRTFYFVLKGGIRTYYLTRGGDEKTRYVMLDNSMGTALASFIAQKPSFELIEALEPTEMLCISHEHFYRLVDEMPAWQKFYQTILEMAYSFQTEKIESMVTLDARQRYLKILNEAPMLVQRLSNKVLSSYLDIRQETLSRIKSK